MKKIIMIVAGMGMIGGAFADSTKVSQDVTATVSNVCTYAVDSQENVNNQKFNQPSKDLGNYNALAQTDASVSMGNFYIFRCTSGTPWNTPNPYNAQSTIELTNKDNAASKKLIANYTVTTEDQDDTVNGDIHSAGINFTINRGQWQARSGAYTGNLTVTINYN